MHSAIIIGSRLHSQYFATGVDDAGDQALLLVLALAVEGAREAEGEQHRRLALDRQVREHVLHQRLLDEATAERDAMLAPVQRLVDRRAHHPRHRDDDVEAREVRHLDQGRDAASRLADEPRERAVVLDLARGVRAVADLVLEPLDEKGLRVPSGSERGTKKQVSAPSSCASVRKPSDIGAEQNHL